MAKLSIEPNNTSCGLLATGFWLLVSGQIMEISILHKRLNILGKKLNRFIQTLERNKINKIKQK